MTPPNMTIHIIGHKSPDLDSIMAAISYADLKNKLDPENNYIPARAGNLNEETEFILNKFNLKTPELLANIASKNIILVDHNENAQIQDGYKEANILEVIDHHKINFELPAPIEFETKPWGATCSIIAKKYCQNNIEKEKNISGGMLAAILVDTVITKSPTCTDSDKKIINKLSLISGIENWKEFGMEIFKIRSSVSKNSDHDIIKSDFKDFKLKENKFGIGQVETVDLSDFNNRKEGLLKEMNNLMNANDYHSVILFITDIINEGSLFLVASNDQNKIEEALKNKLNNNEVYINGIMSRKKQVIPMLTDIFNS